MKRLVLTAFMAIATTLAAQSLSPLDYGLREATTGIERYQALYNTHVEALKQGLPVSYDSIDTLELEMPAEWKSIPLGPTTDFGGLVIYVTNHTRHGALFTLSQSATAFEMDKMKVDSLDYRNIPELAEGWKLLILNDQNPWTERRGFGYMQYRRDLIVVHDGMGQNSPVMPWNTDSTRIKASFVNIDTTQKVFRNLTMHRMKGCTFRTNLISVSGQYNVLIENIHVTTPKSKMIADGIFSIGNSADITLRNIKVEGTYSGKGSPNKYGYAFSLNNLYNSRFEHIDAWGNWGVFGSNNLNRTLLSHCNVDRFDIHCYGRDAILSECHLEGRQTLYTSFYGKAEFYNCYFKDYVPIRVRSSYNAYTPFDIEIHDCTFELTPKHHYIVRINLLDTADNPRPELKEKCWPNLLVDGMTVIVPWTVGKLYAYDPCDNLKDLKREIGYIDRVELKNIKMIRPNGRSVKIPIKLTTHEFIPKNAVEFTIE
ncbi:MAG: hypothetical protein IKR83_05645 [Bacteroidales bacterium]|nr:hypothetical protein [Bacteroidales bacterium]